jgi:hypothetical protein
LIALGLLLFLPAWQLSYWQAWVFIIIAWCRIFGKSEARTRSGYATSVASISSMLALHQRPLQHSPKAYTLEVRRA